MKNITVSLDDETYRRARMIAAQRDTSVSALVKQFLLELASGETEAERLKREQLALREQITASRAGIRPAVPRRDSPPRRMTPPHFLDTYILLYSISRDLAEAAKQNRAIDLLERDEGALSVQVLQEFYVQATRPTRPDPLPHDIAAGLIRTWLRFRVQETRLSILTGALEIKMAHGFSYWGSSYWDGAIIAATRALGCRELYTEDMTHGREVEGITIINPLR